MPTSLLLDLTPGLVLITVAVLLRAVLVRWFDPLPRRVLWAFVLLIIVQLPLALFGGRALLPLHLLTAAPPFEQLAPAHPPANRLQADLVHEVVPHEVIARKILARGEWPLWNPDVGAGMPILADAQAHAHWLQPITLPALVLPLPQAFSLVAGLRVLAALCFTFLFLRRIGLGEGPAFFGAVAFGFGAFLQVWLLWPLANSAAVLPLVLYAVFLAGERGLRRDWALAAFAAVAVLLSGHPETELYVVLIAVAVGVRAVVRSPGRRWRLLGRYAATAVVAGCLAAPALLPMMEYLPQTHRYHLLERRNQRLDELDPLGGRGAPGWVPARLDEIARRLAPTAAPLAEGSDLYGTYWGETTTYLYGVAFAGTLTLALALAAYGPVRKRFPCERGMLWVGLPLTVVVVAKPPGLRHLFAAIPLLDRSPADHARVTLLVGFFLAVLAAMTLERWCRGEARRRSLAVAGAAVGVLVLAATLAYAPRDPSLEVPASLMDLRRWAAVGQIAALALACGLLLVRRSAGKTFVRAAAPGVLALLVFTELVVLFAPANTALPRSLFYPETEATRFLEHALDHPDGDADGARRSERIVGLGDVLPPNVPSVYGLADPRISNASKPWPYTLVVSPLLRSVREMTDVVNTPIHPLYRLLGVRYLAVRDAFRLEPLRRVFQGDGLFVYEASDPPLPRLFLPAAAEVGTDRWLSWMEANQDFGSVSLVSALSGAPSGQGPGQGAGDARHWASARPAASFLVLDGPAAGADRSPTRLSARAGLVEPRLLASSIYQDGSWHLLVDRQPAVTVRTNQVFVGVWLPAGESRIDLLYRPVGFVFGALLAALAGAIGLAWWLPPPRRGSRSGADRAPLNP